MNNNALTKYVEAHTNGHLVFLILPSVGVARDDSCDSHSRGDLTSIDHDEELHEIIVDLPRTTLHYIYILSSHTLSYLNTAKIGAFNMSRTQLSNLVYHVSLFENLVTLTLLSSGRPSLIAMPCASSGLEFPVNSLILGMTSAL